MTDYDALLHRMQLVTDACNREEHISSLEYDAHEALEDAAKALREVIAERDAANKTLSGVRESYDRLYDDLAAERAKVAELEAERVTVADVLGLEWATRACLLLREGSIALERLADVERERDALREGNETKATLLEAGVAMHTRDLARIAELEAKLVDAESLRETAVKAFAVEEGVAQRLEAALGDLVAAARAWEDCRAPLHDDCLCNVCDRLAKALIAAEALGMTGPRKEER